MNQKIKILTIIGILILSSFIIIIAVRYASAKDQYPPGDGNGGGKTVAYCQGNPDPVIAGKGSTVVWQGTGSKAQWNQSGSGTHIKYAQATWVGVCNDGPNPAAGTNGFHVPNCQQANNAMRMDKTYNEQLIITDANGHASNNALIWSKNNLGFCPVTTSNPLTITIPACPIPAPGPEIDKKTKKPVQHYLGEIKLTNCPKDYTFGQNSQDAGLPGPWKVTYTWAPGCLEDKPGSQYYDANHKAACTAPAKGGICPCTNTVSDGFIEKVTIKDTTEPKWTDNYVCVISCPSPSPSPSPSPQP